MSISTATRRQVDSLGQSALVYNEPVMTIANHHSRFAIIAGRAALLACICVALACAAFYFRVILPYVRLPADILMWSESEFVSNIIKMRTGQPIYTAPQDSNSQIYTPGASVATYTLARLVGRADSIATLRVIQLLFVGAASFVAVACCRRLRRLADPDGVAPFGVPWMALALPVLFLAATSPNVNMFVHCLHTDALVLLCSIFFFWALLGYLEKPTWTKLILVSLSPGIGFLVKPFLVSWGIVIVTALVVYQPKNYRRLVIAALVGGISFAIALGGCYLLWRENFVFWVFTVMGGARKTMSLTNGMNMSIGRSIDHTLRAWVELMLGVIGGCLLLRGSRGRAVTAIFASWFVLICSEAYSSGAGWGVLYHFGPGVVIGVVILMTALPAIWPGSPAARPAASAFANYLTWPALAVMGITTVLVGLKAFPNRDPSSARWFPGRNPDPDVYRYIADIEHEFEHGNPKRILLDVGSWIYLKENVVALDRATSLGDQPLAGIYDNFNVFLGRIREHYYDKILVRDLYADHCLYEWKDWARSPGVRRVLLENYDETRVIPAAAGDNQLLPQIFYTGSVSVLTPKKTR
jgi:hypothetical protein